MQLSVPANNTNALEPFDSQIGPIPEIVRTVLKGVDSYAVYAVGSTADGRALAHSDLDLLAIVNEISAIPERAGYYAVGSGVAVRKQVFRGGGRQIDVEYWSLQDVQHAFGAMRRTMSNPLVFFSDDVIRLLHRLTNAIALDGGNNAQELQREVPLPQLRHYTTEMGLYRYKSYIEDLADWTAARREEGIDHLAEMVLDGAIDAYLGQCGCTNPNAKWRPLEIQKYDPALAAAVSAILAERPGEGGIHGYSRRVARLATLVAGAVRLALPYAKLVNQRALPRTSGEIPVAVRCDFAYLNQMPSGELVIHVLPDRYVEVNDTCALVWLLCDGISPRAWIEETMVRLSGESRARVHATVGESLELLRAAALTAEF